MAARRSSLVLALLAFVIAVAYAAYVAPEWEPRQDDQADFLQLAEGIAARGEFTRAQPDEAFIAEPHRRPGYPLFLAALCLSVGCGHWQIAVTQAVIFGGIVLLTHALAVRVVGTTRAIFAAGLVAVYLPLAYYAALAMSEIVATALLLSSLLLYLAARERSSIAFGVACGATCGLLALTRPLFMLLPAVFVMVQLVSAVSARRTAGSATAGTRVLAVVVIAAVLVQAPFIAYSYRWFGEPLLSTSGTVLFRGYLQGDVTGTAEEVERFSAAAVGGADASELALLGRSIGLDPVESAEVAGAYRDLVPFETAPDRTAKIAAFLQLNRSLQQRATRLIAHDPFGYIARGVTVRTVAFWASDVPVRVETIRDLPFGLLLALVSVQLILFMGGLAGSAALLRTRTPAAVAIVATLAFVWVMSLPFLAEGRYAIPARPLLAIAVASLRLRSSPRRGLPFT